MWKRSGESSALNRAQALLASKKNSRGVGQLPQGSPAKAQGASDGLSSTRPAPPTTHTLFSDTSDLSTSSWAAEHGTNPTHCTAPEKSQGRNCMSEDRLAAGVRPQSSLGRGGRRFQKKASPPVTNSSQSLVRRSHLQQIPEPRYVSSSHHGSQAAILRKLAEIECRVHSGPQPQGQAGKGPQPAHNVILTPPLATPQEAVTQTLEATTLLTSAQFRNDQSEKVKCFLKNKVAASESSVGSGADVKARSRAAASTLLLGGLETSSVKGDYGVNLESDEEDMRKLLGESLDSTDNSFVGPEKSSSVKKTKKMLSRKIQPTPPAADVQHLLSNTSPPHCPASPSHRSSPFRFTGQAQADFSPSAVSPSLSPSCVSPSLSRRLSSAHRGVGPQHFVCSMSDHTEVLSLEELFPVQPASEELCSVMSAVSSEDFKLNVVTLDELVPATTGFTEKTPQKQREEHNLLGFGSPDSHEKRYKKAEQQQDKKEEDNLDYQSDFESESQTDLNCSASQVSEQLKGNEEEVASEVRDDASVSDMFQGRTEDDYSNTFTDPSCWCVSRTSGYSCASESLSRSRDSRSPKSHIGQTSSHHPGRYPATRRVVKEAAVQTQPATYMWSTGLAYMNHTSVAAHSLGTETVETLSTYNPTVFVLNEMLKHQLATTRQFIESSRHLHASLVQSLQPPNYRYTTLEETKEYIRMHRSPKLTMEEALKEAMQEIQEYHVLYVTKPT